MDPIATEYVSSTDYTFKLLVVGESNADGYCGLASVEWSACSSSPCTATWTPISTDGCLVDGGNIDGVALNPWFSYDSASQRLWIWGQLNYRWVAGAYEWWGGLCSLKADGTGQQQVIDPSDGSHYYDVKGVLPVPEMDRTILVQPVVNPVTHWTCEDGGVDCTRPDPLLLEYLRPLGGAWAWSETTLPTTGLPGLRGEDLVMDWAADPYELYYVSTGHGVANTAVSW